jgi:hypothetical protein
MHRTALAVALVALVSACESKPTDGAPSAKPSGSQATPAKPSAKPSAAAASAAPSASAAPAASASGEAAAPGEPKKLDTGEAFLKLWKLPDGAAAQPLTGMEGWSFTGPKDVKWPGRGDKTAWGAVTVGGKSMAVLVASPEQDEGDQCFPMAEAKKKLGGGDVGGAKVLSEQTFEVPPSEKGDKTTTWGEEIELIVWEKVEGQRGFYAHKMFDHGDDSTHICCASGASGDAKELKGLVDAAATEPMIAVCMSTTFTF